MRNSERRIFHFDMEVKRRGSVTHLPTLVDILSVWKERSDGGTAFQIRAKGDLRFSIEDVELYDENIACLLVSVTDRNSPDAVYKDMHTKETTVHEKTASQGGMKSAHLVVSLSPYKVDTYFCVLEKANKLSHSNVEMLLNRILHDEYDVNKSRFTYAHPGGARTRAGTIKRIEFLPRIELKGYPSAELLNSMEDGKVRDIVLSNTYEKSDFGDNPYLVEKEQHLIVKVKPTFPRGNRLENLTAAVSSRSAEYSTARVRFTGADGKSLSVDFNVDDGSLIDDRNVHSELISGIAPPLAEGYEKIVSRVSRPMMSIVRARQGRQS